MSIKKLKELALEHSKIKHPNIPDFARSIHKYTDKNSNGLTRCVIDWINLSGYQAERISSSGRYIDGTKKVTSHIGQARVIGSGKYIPGNSTNGSADISATIKGRSIKIEIKIGRDKVSEAQIRYKENVERAGGVYFVATSLEQFVEFYLKLITQII